MNSDVSVSSHAYKVHRLLCINLQYCGSYTGMRNILQNTAEEIFHGEAICGIL